MVYLKTRDGRIFEYPHYLKELGYKITYTLTQFSMYCLYLKSPRVVYLDEHASVLYLKDEMHPHPFIENPGNEILPEAPVGMDVVIAESADRLLGVLTINAADRKHYLYNMRELGKLSEFPGGVGYGSIWTEDGLAFVARAVPKPSEAPAEETEEGEEGGEKPEPSPSYELRLLRAARIGSLGKRIDSLDVKSIEESSIEEEDGQKTPVIRVVFKDSEAIRDLISYYKTKKLDDEDSDHGS